jgi:hypothetical protein
MNPKLRNALCNFQKNARNLQISIDLLRTNEDQIQLLIDSFQDSIDEFEVTVDIYAWALGHNLHVDLSAHVYNAESPKDLTKALESLEFFYGEGKSNVQNDGTVVVYRYETKVEILDVPQIVYSVSLFWHKPDNSQCQIVVDHVEKVEEMQYVTIEKPIFRVICP